MFLDIMSTYNNKKKNVFKFSLMPHSSVSQIVLLGTPAICEIDCALPTLK
jgi:hypothetical protein